MVERNMTERPEPVDEKESIDLKQEFPVPITFPSWSIKIDSGADSQGVLKISEDFGEEDEMKYEICDEDFQEASEVKDSSTLDSLTSTKTIRNREETHSQVVLKISENFEKDGDKENGIKRELPDDVLEPSAVKYSSSLNSFTNTKTIKIGGQTHSKHSKVVLKINEGFENGGAKEDGIKCELSDGKGQKANNGKDSSSKDSLTSTKAIRNGPASTTSTITNDAKSGPSSNAVDDNEDTASLFQCSSLATLERHIQMHEEKNLKLDDEIGLLSCSFCGQCFIDDLDLSVHLQDHFQDKLFRCTQCDSYFRKKGAFIVHLRKHCSKPGKSYKCKTCGNCVSSDSKCCFHFKEYPSIPAKLRRRDTASLMKPVHLQMFECQMCRKCFLTKNDLASHMLTHF